MNLRGKFVKHTLAACIILHSVLIPTVVRGFWPAEDSLWTVEFVNTSRLCTNATIEDVNPEDPAVWQFTKEPVPQEYNFLHHVHSLFGKTFENEGHPQVTRPSNFPPLTNLRKMASEHR